MSTEPPATDLHYLRPDDKAAPAADYLVRLLGELAGVRVACLSPEQSGQMGNGPVILHFPLGKPEEVLATILSSTAEKRQVLWIHRDASFWGSLPLVENSVPPEPDDLQSLLSAAGQMNLTSYLRGGENEAYTLTGDILAASLWMITRAEEYAATPERKLDAHDRFLASRSALPGEIYDTPAVARGLLWIWKHLRGSTVKEPKPGVPGMQTIALTHDVDLLRKFTGSAGVRRLLGRMTRNPTGTITELRNALPVLLGSARDPYDSFDDLFTIKDRISAPSTWFLMSEQGGQNADYGLADPVLRNVLVRGRGFRDEFALHSSWNSGGSPDKIQNEASAVSTASGDRAVGVRPHYLRFSLPETWRHMAAAGMRYSSSLAFPDRSGFRCGWSGPFRPFDLHQMKELPIIEIPLVCMDVTLSVYEKIPAELALEKLTNLLDAACEGIPRGAFVFLWHNTMADRRTHPGYWDTFEYFFSIASGSSTFVTLQQICEDYETLHAHTV